MEENEVKTERT